MTEPTKKSTDSLTEYLDERERLFANPQWGSWYLKRETFELINGKTGYAIDLERCEDSAQILDWIFQVSQKAGQWEIVNLLGALNDILDPQANYCSRGINTKTNPRKVAQAWLNPPRKVSKQ